MFEHNYAFNGDVSKWQLSQMTQSSSVTKIFANAVAFTDANFFCSGSWMNSQLKVADFDGSGVVDFSCGNTVLRNMHLQSAVDAWFDGTYQANSRDTITDLEIAAKDVVIKKYLSSELRPIPTVKASLFSSKIN